ncbi:hypothetical protein [Arthrobacter sp. ISL-28]|uniref:hypothetical protein n=1 Tax=Arthrobacter sp. ISL-28 TaxID=2819108 RepID=UPI001BE8F7E6|nr:hypothetical protein [Arthrobacter sp. ISL-28]MBT2521388.1 hypothetical protein [Arthrobacter sp. ISL-28]
MSKAATVEFAGASGTISPKQLRQVFEIDVIAPAAPAARRLLSKSIVAISPPNSTARM